MPVRYICSMQGKELRRLFFLSLIAASGLLALQCFRVRQDWKDTENFLSRQLNYTFRKAAEEESRIRTESFYDSIHRVIVDGQYHFYTWDNSRNELKITMHNARNPRDVVRTHISLIYQGLMKMSHDSILQNARNDAWSEIRSNILNEYAHIMYTRLYDTLYWKYFNGLKLDSLRLLALMNAELVRYRIKEHPVIHILPRDQALPHDHNTLYSDTIPIDFATVKDRPQTYRLYASMPAMNRAILQRTWLSWASGALLIGLTLFCLYRMYRNILRQKQLDEMKNDFIGNMTHELKTPVATIGAAVDGLQHFDALKDPEKTARYLAISRIQLERLDHIITEVLNTTVYERKQATLIKAMIPLRAELEKIVTSFQEASVSHFSCVLNCETDLHVFADPFHFSGVVRNILDNAIKYVPENLMLQIGCERMTGKIEIHIRDNGPGIPAEQLSHIFERFYRVPTGNIHDVKGFGIGLFYVRQIAEQHGGIASATSKPGSGTTISLIFPDNTFQPS